MVQISYLNWYYHVNTLIVEKAIPSDASATGSLVLHRNMVYQNTEELAKREKSGRNAKSF